MTWSGFVLTCVICHLHIIPSKFFTVKAVELVLPRSSSRINWNISLNSELLYHIRNTVFGWINSV